MKTYTELMTLPTFEERFEYLQNGIVHSVGLQTFGSQRYTNQAFYLSYLWIKVIRPEIIIRDYGCDLAILGYEIPHPSLMRVHHINPLTPEMFDEENPLAYDYNNLITMHRQTHSLLTYGGGPPQKHTFIERKPNDHIPWRKE